MARYSIDLPDPLNAFVEQQVALRRYPDANAFFCEAVARIQRWEDEAIPLTEEEERLICEALDDPTPSTVWTRDSMEAIRSRLIERHRKVQD